MLDDNRGIQGHRVPGSRDPSPVGDDLVQFAQRRRSMNIDAPDSFSSGIEDCLCRVNFDGPDGGVKVRGEKVPGIRPPPQRDVLDRVERGNIRQPMERLLLTCEFAVGTAEHEGADRSQSQYYGDHDHIARSTALLGSHYTRAADSLSAV